MIDKVKQIAKSGINDQQVLPIILEIHPNQYSRRLVESDPSFNQRGDNYYGLFH